MILIHGWPGIASTWLPQMRAFALQGFHCIAADTCGYGQSHHSRDLADYTVESLVRDQLDLLAHLGREKATWVAHDWGCGILGTLVRHYPEKCEGTVFLAVPYGVLEMGLEELMKTINWDIYDKEKYPYAQWEYQVAYEQIPDVITGKLDRSVERFVRLGWGKGDPSSLGQPGRTSTVLRDKGWVGGLEGDAMPDNPLKNTVFWDEESYQDVVQALKKSGFWGATAYYRNHGPNREYNQSAKRGGKVEVPVLFIDAKYDGVCATNEALLNRKGDGVNLLTKQREQCQDLTEVSVEAGHWVGMEKYEEVNAAIAKWLVEKVKVWPSPKEVQRRD